MPAINNDPLTLIKAAYNAGPIDARSFLPPELAKGFFTQQGDQLVGLQAYDLAPVAAVLYPVMTPLRNRIPRVTGGFNIQSNWKAITGINTTNQRAGISEGNRSGFIEHTTADYLANYRGYGLDSYVTFEADFASATFADLKSLAVSQLLQSVMIQEERMDLGGNTSVPLGVTPTPSLAASAGNGTIPGGTALSVICVALGPQAYLDVAGHNNGVLGVAFNPTTVQVPGRITRDNANGTHETFNGGSAQKSAAATITPGATGSVTATVTPVRGAWGYAWFAGPAGQERLAAISTSATAVIKDTNTVGQLASALPAEDCSCSHLEYDGLFTQAAKPGSHAYWKALPNGAALTSDGAGGITEFEAAFLDFYNLYRISPSLILVSARECVDITRLIIGNGGAPLIRFNADANSIANGSITAGVSIGAYLNKVMGTQVPIVVHPNLAPGTVFFLTESQNMPYPLPATANVFQKRLRRDYYQMDWPLTKRQHEYGVYADGVLQHFAPFSMGVITNITSPQG